MTEWELRMLFRGLASQQMDKEWEDEKAWRKWQEELKKWVHKWTKKAERLRKGKRETLGEEYPEGGTQPPGRPRSSPGDGGEAAPKKSPRWAKTPEGGGLGQNPGGSETPEGEMAAQEHLGSRKRHREENQEDEGRKKQKENEKQKGDKRKRDEDDEDNRQRNKQQAQ